jgi:hypothetical protein
MIGSAALVCWRNSAALRKNQTLQRVQKCDELLFFFVAQIHLKALVVEPVYDPLRDDPRLQELLSRVGLAR